MRRRSCFRLAVLFALTALPTWANLNVKNCAPSSATTPMQYQDLVSCAITTAGQSGLFTFSGQAGDTILIGLVNLNNSSADACFRVIPPGGSPGGNICASFAANVDYTLTYRSNVQLDTALPGPGAYTIQVLENSGSKMFNYSLYVIEKIPVPSSALAVSYGAVMPGIVEVLGDHDLFFLDGSAGDTLNITLSRTSGNTQISCFSTISPDSARTDTCAPFTENVDYTLEYAATVSTNVTLSKSGPYELQVWASGDASTFPFNLVVQCFGVCSSTPLPPAAPVTAMVLPQFVFGGGWYSALYFTNAGGTSVSFQVNFISDTGGALVVPSLGGSSVTINLASRATSVIEAPSVGQLTDGYVSVALPAGVAGYGVFRQSVSGFPDQEAVVPLSASSGTASTLVWDESNLVTGVAIVNPGNAATSVSVIAYGSSGQIIGTSSVSLSAGNKTAVALRDLPGLSAIAGTRGSADFVVGTGNIAVLGLRFDGVAFTSIPTTSH